MHIGRGEQLIAECLANSPNKQTCAPTRRSPSPQRTPTDVPALDRMEVRPAVGRAPLGLGACPGGWAPQSVPYGSLARRNRRFSAMAQLTLVRHGQASFNTADYDRLSTLGTAQAEALARHWLEQGVAFDKVITGTLTRQQQTERACASVFEAAGVAWPEPAQLASLDEFPAEKVVRKLTPELCLRDRQVRRSYRRYARGGEGADDALMSLVMRVCEYWAREDVATPVSPSWPEFRAQVEGAMAAMGERLQGGDRVLAVTSGGVISVAMQLVTGEPLEEAIARNWNIPNASRTEFQRVQTPPALRLTERAAVDHLPPQLHTLR